ncbi:hypothetical protein NKI38_23060, partial [Mesorhizobium sp. M0621]|uniref:hypothetical protein n=1 Tax=Mesorhizobium sp. M0621 TaxID=2956974 RepID=UPI00333AC359
ITTTPHRKSLPLSDESESQNKAKRDFCSSLLEQFQEKCETVFRPELRQNKQRERFGVSVKL